MEKQFIEEFESDGGKRGDYIFELRNDIYSNPLIMMSEIEYNLLKELRPQTKSDYSLMLKLIESLKHIESKEIDDIFKLKSKKDIIDKYSEYIKVYLSNNGVMLKEKALSTKEKKNLEVENYLREFEEKKWKRMLNLRV